MGDDLTPHQQRTIDALRDRRGITLDTSRPIVPTTSPPTEPATAPPGVAPAEPGRLTPADAETRTEYKYVLTYDDGTQKHRVLDELAVARSVAASPADWNPPGPPGEVFQRVVTTTVGPWLPVPAEPAPVADRLGDTWASPVTVTGFDTEEDTA